MFRCETKNHPNETNAPEKNDTAKANYFFATVGVQEKELPTQTLENAFKGNDQLKKVVAQFKH